uniref:Secreted protein n=1 Tax=Caenorhabditis japonica TaxID=281687 RepID=A0A8R1HYP7_CAEJA
MLSTLLFLALSSVLIEQTLAGATCNLDTPPATWARVLAKNAFFNAWQPNDYFDLPGFCVNPSYKTSYSKSSYDAPMFRTARLFIVAARPDLNCETLERRKFSALVFFMLKLSQKLQMLQQKTLPTGCAFLCVSTVESRKCLRLQNEDQQMSASPQWRADNACVSTVESRKCLRLHSGEQQMSASPSGEQQMSASPQWRTANVCVSTVESSKCLRLQNEEQKMSASAQWRADNACVSTVESSKCLRLHGEEQRMSASPQWTAANFCVSTVESSKFLLPSPQWRSAKACVSTLESSKCHPVHQSRRSSKQRTLFT